MPGINLVYAGLNRLILDSGASILLVTGPGHGAPANLANLWIDGCLEDVNPELARDRDGLARLIHDFSWPGGFPSHLAPVVPGTIHEGGELGYALSTAFGAALDNPDLIVACIVGDGEAETGPTAGAWHSNKFLDPASCGAVLPVLHVNGYKIANPTIYKTMSNAELTKLFEGFGWHPLIVEGEDLDGAMLEALRTAHAEIREIQTARARRSPPERPPWPMIILRSPKGWTGPGGRRAASGRHLAGAPGAGNAGADQPGAPAGARGVAAFLPRARALRRERCADRGRARACPTGDLRMGANPHSSAGAAQAAEPARPGRAPMRGVRAGCREGRRDDGARLVPRGRLPDECRRAELPHHVPRRGGLEPAEPVLEVEDHTYVWPLDPKVDIGHRPDGRIMEILSEHNCQGWLQGYLLTGRHGVFPCYEAFIPIVEGMVNQYAKFLKMSRDEAPWRKPVASLNYLLSSVGWRQDHNGYSHQMPGFINSMLNRKEHIARVFLPPDANTLLVTMEQCLAATDQINLVIASKHPLPQWLDMEQAKEHVARGASVWEWAGNTDGEPDVVLASAGTIPTLELLAAVQLLRAEVPELKVRFVNVVDLFSLATPSHHPSGMSQQQFHEHVHRGPARAVQLPRLPIRGAPAPAPAHAPGALPRAGL